MAAPIVDSVQRGADIGGMLTSAGQRGLDRLQQQFQFGQEFSNQKRQQAIARDQRDRHLATQLNFEHQRHLMSINARANLQKQASQEALKRSVVQAGLTEKLAEQNFEREMLAAREAAKMQAQNVEYKYTTAQRIEDAKFARAEQMIQSSDSFTPEEKQIALQRLQIARAGIRQPTEILGDPNKAKFPEGKGIGETWTENGGVVRRDENGVPQILFRPDQMPEYLQQKQENELKIKQQEWENKLAIEKQKAQLEREKLLAEKRIELLTEEIVTDSGTRRRTPQEVSDIMEAAFGEEQKRNETPWWDDLKQKGYMVEEEDLQYPQSVGGSRAFLRTMERVHGSFENIPDELKPAVESAARVVAAYDRQ